MHHLPLRRRGPGCRTQFVSVGTDVSLRKEVESRLVGLLNTAASAWPGRRPRAAGRLQRHLSRHARLWPGRTCWAGTFSTSPIPTTSPPPGPKPTACWPALAWCASTSAVKKGRPADLGRRRPVAPGQSPGRGERFYLLDYRLSPPRRWRRTACAWSSAAPRRHLGLESAHHAVYYSARFRELLSAFPGRDEGEASRPISTCAGSSIPTTPGGFRRPGGPRPPPGRRVFDCELRFLHRNGGYRWFRARARRSGTSGGKVERFAGSFTDFSALRTPRIQLRQAREAANWPGQDRIPVAHDPRTAHAAQRRARFRPARKRPPPSPSPAQRKASGKSSSRLASPRGYQRSPRPARIEAMASELAMAEVEVGPLGEESLTLISPLASRHRVTVVNWLGLAGASSSGRRHASAAGRAQPPVQRRQYNWKADWLPSPPSRPTTPGGWKSPDGGIGLRPDQVDALFPAFYPLRRRCPHRGYRHRPGHHQAPPGRGHGRPVWRQSAAGWASTFSVTLARAIYGAAAPPAGVPLPLPADFVAVRPFSLLHRGRSGQPRTDGPDSQAAAAASPRLRRQRRPGLALAPANPARPDPPDIDLPDLDGFILKDLLAAETSLADVPAGWPFGDPFRRANWSAAARPGLPITWLPVKVGEVLA